MGHQELAASMGPGRLTGMNGARQARSAPERAGFNGARSIDRDERRGAAVSYQARIALQWGPVD